MSLVSYGSSDESENSDNDETKPPFPSPTVSSSGDDARTCTQGQGQRPVSSARSLLSSLPPPKSSKPEIDTIGYGKIIKKSDESQTVISDKQSRQPSSTADRRIRSLNLPPPKKGQPVKITIPSLPDPDSDEDEPAPKKTRQGSQGSGLFALLPQPKHAVAKENNRILIPHTLTKKPAESKRAVPVKPKPAGKTTGMAGFLNYGSDDEDEPSSFFSLDEKDTSKPDPVKALKNASQANTTNLDRPSSTVTSSAQAVPLTSKKSPVSLENSKSSMHDVSPMNEPLSFSSTASTNRADAPLDFGANSNVVSSSSHGYTGGGNSYSYSHYEQGYQEYNQPYQEAYPQYTGTEVQHYDYHGNDQEQYEAESTSQDYINDEGFKRLQGKKRKGEAIQIIDIQEDRQDYSSREWLSKSVSEEKEYRSKLRKEQLPTSQQRKKHQITYLAHQAKERELELKNSWAENRLTRKQTQAKYGF